MPRTPARLWGRQYPFERNHLQRSVDLVGLGGLLAVSTIVLVADNASDVLGLALIFAGLISALAAVSRLRYRRETRLGFAILTTRGGGFVVGSAVAFVIVAALVAVTIALP